MDYLENPYTSDRIFLLIYTYLHVQTSFVVFSFSSFWGGGCLTGKFLPGSYYDFIVCFMHIIDEFKVIKCEGYDFEATRNGRRYQTAWCVFYIVRTSGESI